MGGDVGGHGAGILYCDSAALRYSLMHGLFAHDAVTARMAVLDCPHGPSAHQT